MSREHDPHRAGSTEPTGGGLRIEIDDAALMPWVTEALPPLYDRVHGAYEDGDKTGRRVLIAALIDAYLSGARTVAVEIAAQLVAAGIDVSLKLNIELIGDQEL